MSIAKRMSWAVGRKTTRVEDRAYSLLGIFNINMPMLYGEGWRAFSRLQEQIMRSSTDNSILAWGLSLQRPNGALLASSPDDFAESHLIEQFGRPGSFEVTNRGLRITLPTIKLDHFGNYEHLAILNCRYENNLSGALAIRLRQYSGTEDYHAVHEGHHTGSPDFKSRGPSRLAVVSTRQMKYASMCPLEITRTFEPTISPLRFWLRLPEGRGIGPAIKVKDAWPPDMWSFSTGIMQAQNSSSVRGAVLLQYERDRDILLSFGCDTVAKRDSDGSAAESRLLPGVWADFCDPTPEIVDDLQPNRRIICRHQGESSLCQNPVDDGCPHMRMSADLENDRDSETRSTMMFEEDFMRETVFVITVHLTQKMTYQFDTSTAHELDGEGAQLVSTTIYVELRVGTKTD